MDLYPSSTVPKVGLAFSLAMIDWVTLIGSEARSRINKIARKKDLCEKHIESRNGGGVARIRRSIVEMRISMIKMICPP